MEAYAPYQRREAYRKSDKTKMHYKGLQDLEINLYVRVPLLKELFPEGRISH